MKSTKRFNNFDEVSREINKLIDAINASEVSAGYGGTGKSGDIRVVEDDNNQIYLEVKGDKGWYTTFTGVMNAKLAKGRPYPHFPILEVDNFFATQFTVRQLNARNGDDIYSDVGIVESVTNTTVTFKDQTNYNICPFAVNDLIVTRRIKADKSLDISYVKATVTAVNGRTITVTYTSTDKFQIADVVVRVGNTTTATRQDSIYLTTNATYSPYMAIYDNINSFDTAGSPTTAWTTATSKVLIGNGKSLNASYTHGVYINAGGEFRVSPSATVDGVVTHTPVYTSGATFPVSPVATDWHFYTKTPPDAPYKTNTWYKYSGSVWEKLGLLGTYIDSTGVYTGIVLANQVIAGTFIGFIIEGNATPSTSGGIYIDQDEIILYKGGTAGVDDFLWKVWNNIVPVMSWESTGFGVNVSLASMQANTYITGATQGLFVNHTFRAAEWLIAGGDKFVVNASGNLVLLNNITYSFPSVAPTLNQVLTCSNATGGVLSWADVANTMIYPGAGIALSTGSAWGTSITDASANWNTAYGWGNHASAGYLTSITAGDGITVVGSTVSAKAYTATGITVSVNGIGISAGNGLGNSANQLVAVVTAPLTFTTGSISMPAAATAQNGYLTSTDWNTFNGKSVVSIGSEGLLHAITLSEGTLNIYSRTLTINGTGTTVISNVELV
jgi:hypothetical protein